MKKRSIQYTIRDIPQRTDQRVREVATEYGTSINTTVLAAISKGIGMGEEGVEHHDLDDLIGTWVQDEECDKALQAMDRVDAELWK